MIASKTEQMDLFSSVQPGPVRESYYDSPRWKQLRTERLILDNHRCRVCNEPAQVVHHRQYAEVMGDESVDDLTSMCHRCHHNHHHPPGAEQVRMDLHARFKDGDMHICPVCDKKCKIYKRKLNSQMAIFLIKMVRESGVAREWVDVRDILNSSAGGKNSSDGTYLRHWGLIEGMPSEEDGSSSNSGVWRPTDRGIAFAERSVTVLKHVYLYNNRRLGFGDEQTDIIEALGAKFDYEELMRRSGVPCVPNGMGE
jgi:5-methylcytosine-specific restriction protein A